MASPVVLPKIGLTMTEGTLAQWLVADGACVEKGRVRELLERPGVLLVQDQPSR